MIKHLRWSCEFLHELHHHGVRHAIISPGSRSTPLTLTAAIHDGLQKQIVLDERSAGFIALGIAKATGKPAALICTSGTAAANYLPAITEAKESGVPMIVLTADRPPNLRGIGSSQTVDQIKLYGDQAVFFHEAGEPHFESADLKRLRYAAKQAVEHSVFKGGAAHINFAFRKPLEPSSKEIIREKDRLNTLSSSGNDATHSTKFNKIIRPAGHIKELISESNKPLLIAGPANPSHQLTELMDRLSQILSAPVIAEPGSGLSNAERQIHRFEQFLRSKSNRESLRPDLIIRFGDQPFTKSMLNALEEWTEIPTLHITAREADQDHALSVLHKIRLTPTDRFELEGIEIEANRNWFSEWKSLDDKAHIELNKCMEEAKVLTDGHLFHLLNHKLSDQWNVMLSNSFIPRDMALFGKSNKNQFVNRGAAGIDGIISTAAGISASTCRPTCCVVGDLAFLHDSNALLSRNYATDPFLIAVINNGGGNIFNMLPISKNEEFFEDYFLTPQSVDVEHLAAAYGFHYLRIDSIEKLREFQPEHLEGKMIVELITDPKASMNIRKSLWNV